MKRNRKLNVGMLGAGGMGRTHAKNLAKIRGTAVTAVCDSVRDKAKLLSAECTKGKAAVYTDFDLMLKEIPLDALYICLPPFAHSGQAEAAAKKGIHLFLEKPVALHTKRARSMVRAAEKAGVVAQIGYHMRFALPVMRLKKMIADGSAGRPTLFDGRFGCNSLHVSWWRDKRKSGGQVLEQLIHVYDLAIHLLGEPRVATAFTANLCHRDVAGYTVEDTSTAALRFRSGALANISGSNCTEPQTWNTTFTVVCEKVTAHFREFNEAEFVFTGGGKVKREVVKSDRDVKWEEDKAFIAAVRGGKQRGATIREGLTGLLTVTAVLESAKSGGRPVRVG